MTRENYDRNSAGKSSYDRIRDELYRSAEFRDAKYDKHHTSHECCHGQPVNSVFLDNPVNDHDESPGGPANLNAGSTESAYDEAGDYRCPKSAIRRNTACDCKGDCQRKRNDSYDDSGRQIPKELGAIVVAERGNQFWA